MTLVLGFVAGLLAFTAWRLLMRGIDALFGDPAAVYDAEKRGRSSADEIR